jgi:hypothetical protein
VSVVDKVWVLHFLYYRFSCCRTFLGKQLEMFFTFYGTGRFITLPTRSGIRSEPVEFSYPFLNVFFDVKDWALQARSGVEKF